jgi:hypothetical protein
VGDALDASQVLQLQTREAIRAYVRELDGWDHETAQTALLEAIRLIEGAKSDPALAAKLLTSEPRNLDDLINGSMVPPGEDSSP